jgi:hypothetical protein
MIKPFVKLAVKFIKLIHKMKNQLSLGWMLLFSLVLQVYSSEAFAHTTNPPQGRWEILGKTMVNYSLDRDEISVTAAEGEFSAIQLKVKKAGINMHKVTVHFGDGSTQDVDIRNDFSAGSESRVIDLEGKKRIIKKVVFWYDTKALRKNRALIELWGRH